jgi:hypothetical protein
MLAGAWAPDRSADQGAGVGRRGRLCLIGLKPPAGTSSVATADGLELPDEGRNTYWCVDLRILTLERLGGWLRTWNGAPLP